MLKSSAPDRRTSRTNSEFPDVVYSVEGVIGAPDSQILKCAEKFLPESPFVEIIRGALQFCGGHVATFGGGEMERLPIGPFRGAFDQLMKTIEALGRTDEQGIALPVGERRPQNFLPGSARDGGIFVQDQEIETIATQRIVIIGAA